MKSEKARQPKTLIQKLFEIMKAIPAIEKTGEMLNDAGDKVVYKYHEADGIRRPFRKQLIKHGVMCLPTSITVSSWGNQTATGGTYNLNQQLIRFTFYDISSGETLQCEAVGIGGDGTDRMAPKAAIQALKYFLVNAFFVEGLELDGDSDEEQMKAREITKGAQTWERTVAAVNQEFSWFQTEEGERIWYAKRKISKKTLAEAEGKRVRIRVQFGTDDKLFCDRLEILTPGAGESGQ